jgi:hypothetical protein
LRGATRLVTVHGRIFCTVRCGFRKAEAENGRLPIRPRWMSVATGGGVGLEVAPSRAGVLCLEIRLKELRCGLKVRVIAAAPAGDFGPRVKVRCVDTSGVADYCSKT